MLIRHFRAYVSAMERNWVEAQQVVDEQHKWLHSEAVAWLQSAMHDHFERVIHLCKKSKIGPYGCPTLSSGFVADQVPLKNVVTYYSQVKQRNLPLCRDAWLAHLCMITGDTDWGTELDEFMEHLVAAIYSSYKFLVASDADALQEFSETVADQGVPEHILDLAKNKSRAEAVKWQVKEIIQGSVQFQRFHHWWARYQYAKPFTNGSIITIAKNAVDDRRNRR